MLKINSIKPLFNKIVTTCDTYESDKTKGGIIIKTNKSKRLLLIKKTNTHYANKNSN